MAGQEVNWLGVRPLIHGILSLPEFCCSLRALPGLCYVCDLPLLEDRR